MNFKNLWQWQTPAAMPESEFGERGATKQRRIIHFSSGETMEEEDSEEEEEQQRSGSPFRESTQKVRRLVL